MIGNHLDNCLLMARSMLRELIPVIFVNRIQWQPLPGAALWTRAICGVILYHQVKSRAIRNNCLGN